MKKQLNLRRAAGVYGGIALCLAVLSVVLRCVNLNFFFDAEIGYYASDAALPVVASCILAASVIFFAAASFFLFRKSELAPSPSPSLALRVASSIAAVGFLFLASVNILDGSVWSGILALGAGLSFAITISKTAIPPLFRLLCALCVILRLLMILANSYFDITVQMNAPDKLMLHLACLAGMMMAISDVRASVVKLRPALFTFSFACGALLLGTYAIPYLLDAHTGILGAWDVFTSVPEAYALLALLVYAVIRLLELARKPVAAEIAEEEEAVEETTEEKAAESAEEPAKIDESEETEESKEPEEAETSEESEKSEQPEQSPEQEA